MHFITWNTYFNVTVIMSARGTCKITKLSGNIIFNKFKSKQIEDKQIMIVDMI